MRAAAEDATGAAPGGPAAAGHALIRRADSIRVVVPLGWRSVNPALLVAAKLGFDADSMPPELVLTAVGGNAPQALLHDACRAISRGDLGVVLVTGAEAMYTRAAGRRDPSKPVVNWSSQPAERTPHPTLFGTERPGATDFEISRGIILPIQAYPLFENALRAANGWTLAEHRARIGSLWSRFSQVAASNPYAWIRRAFRPEEITEPSPDNRMISFPYPKLCTANMQVDQGAGVHRLLGGGGAGRRGARGEMGVPAGGGRCPRPLVHFAPPRAPSLAGDTAGRPGRLRTGRGGPRRPRADRSLLVLPRCGADGRSGDAASPSTTLTGR